MHSIEEIITSRCLSILKWYLLEVKQSSSRTPRLVPFRGSNPIRMKSSRFGPQPTDALTCSPRLPKLKFFYFIFYQRIRLGEEIKRAYDDPVNQSRDGFQELNTMARKTAAFSKCIHAVILVLKANDPRLEEGIYKGTLQKIRDHFRTHGNNDINQW